MNLRFKMILGCACCFALAGCSDDNGSDRVPCDPNTFVTACSKDASQVAVCSSGYVMMNTCPFGCDIASGTCKDAQGNVTSCTDASYPPTCIDGMTRAFCSKEGVRDQETCSAGTTCVDGRCVEQVDNKCTAETYPDACADPYTRTFCNSSGFKSSEKCVGMKCVDGKCVVPKDPDACDESYVPKCINPKILSTCVNGKIQHNTCAAGTICNDAIKEAKCKAPSFHDPCNPATFSEQCTKNDTQAVTCDPESKKVVIITCEKEYGDGYTCDIRENFSKPGLNAVMCYSDAENCSAEGELIYDYCWHEEERNGGPFRQFYKETYTCSEFNRGFHMYFTKIEKCPGNTKCGQDEIKRECSDVSQAESAPGRKK